MSEYRGLATFSPDRECSDVEIAGIAGLALLCLVLFVLALLFEREPRKVRQ